MITLLLALLSATASAESASTLPAGAATAYGGLGLGTFRYGSSGLIRDRQWRARLDLYGAIGLTDRLQLSLDGPFAANWVQEIEGRGPCPTEAYEGDYCDPTLTVGEVGLHARYRLTAASPALTLGLGVRTDAWNADTRQRWTNAGLGTTSLVGSLISALERGDFGVLAAAHYRLTAGRSVDAGLGEIDLPADELSGLFEVKYAPEGIAYRASVSGLTRLWGIDYGDEYTDYYAASPDRWASLRYRALRAELKLSLPLGEVSGLHLSGGRVLLAEGGPRDAADLSIGLHRYFPG